ncbi:MAG: hypothetical protein R2751_17340 [Bacteroidales bacterium]
MGKTLASKLLALALLGVIMNWVYARFLYERDIQSHSPVVNLVRELPPGVDILYVGESSNTASRKDDADKRAISAFLGDCYPDLVVDDITKPAAHAGIYRTLLEQIPADQGPKTVVVTLNLRSFNAQWIYSDLETALQKSMVLLGNRPPLLNRFLLSFQAYDIKTPEERSRQFKRKWKRDRFQVPFDLPYRDVIQWDRAIGRSGLTDAEGKRDQAATELACHYVKGYAFQIDFRHNPRIRDFDALVRLADRREWNLVFHLMAENTEQAERLVGEDLLWFMDDNAARLRARYEARGVLVVDNLHAVADREYIDRDWTTEHYAEKGRKTVARNLARGLRSLHPDAYRAPAWEEELTP